MEPDTNMEPLICNVCRGLTVETEHPESWSWACPCGRTHGVRFKKRGLLDLTTQECTHDWRWVRDDYGSLGDGGSYEVHRCTKCKKRSYSQLPD